MKAEPVSSDIETSDWVLKISRIKMLKGLIEKVYNKLQELSDYSGKQKLFLNQ